MRRRLCVLRRGRRARCNQCRRRASGNRKETERLADGILRHADAGIARGEEGDHLGSTYRGIRVRALRRVTPCVCGIAALGREDKVDCLLKRGTDTIIVNIAVRFRRARAC